MKDWIIYGLANAIAGLGLGLYIALSAIGDGYYVFPIAAPISAFIVGSILWHRIVRHEYRTTKIVITGILTGTISHYITFVLLAIGISICYWITGRCTGSFGEPPAHIFSMMFGAFSYTFLSLFFFGWITVPYAIITGFICKKIHVRKKSVE